MTNSSKYEVSVEKGYWINIQESEPSDRLHKADVYTLETSSLAAKLSFLHSTFNLALMPISKKLEILQSLGGLYDGLGFYPLDWS